MEFPCNNCEWYKYTECESPDYKSNRVKCDKYAMYKNEIAVLFHELCYRMSHGVIVTTIKDINCSEEIDHGKYKKKKFTGRVVSLSSTSVDIYDDITKEVAKSYIDNVKLYLRPLSSMTNEEKAEISARYNYFIVGNKITLKYHRHGSWDDDVETDSDAYFSLFKWLNSRHFDYDGLIKRGLAIEAPEGMYTFE